jgi:hypothetical protein
MFSDTFLGLHINVGNIDIQTPEFWLFMEDQKKKAREATAITSF